MLKQISIIVQFNKRFDRFALQTKVDSLTIQYDNRNNNEKKNVKKNNNHQLTL